MIENTISDCTLSNYSFASNVYLRIKPSLEATSAEIYTVHNSTTLHVKKGESIDKKYIFTRIFDSSYSQEDIFYHSVRQQVINFLLGESSTILTYGASNSGKTYTLYGTPKSPGIIPRAIELLFSAVNCTLAPWYKVIDGNRIVTLNEDERAYEIQCKKDIINPEVIAKEEYTQARLSLNNSNPQLPEERDACGDECMSSVWISVAEIYNDNVYDLLVVNEEEKQPLKMASRKDGSTYVKDLKFIAITTALEACQLLVFVQSKMTIASTVVNDASSRSHTFFTIKLLKYERQNSPEEVQVSTLTFCDVAGSRRFKNRAETGVRLTEWRNINNSLLVLGRCLKTARTSNSIGNVHVAGPFRESKLTRILQKVLAGRETISFIVTIDTEADAFPETLSILNFSAIARKLNAESKVLKRNAFSIMTPRSLKSSTLASIVHTPEKLITVDSEEYETLKRRIKELTEELEEMQLIYYAKRDAIETISRGTQSEKSFLDYEQLEERNAILLKNLETLECDNLDRELELRQKLADQYSTAVKELQYCSKERTQVVEDQGRELLKWSVDQIEAFYKERIDNIMYNKKRKRIDGDVGIQSICQELETENAMMTSKLIVLREMVRNLRAENQSLSTERNKCNFELVLIKEKLTNFHDLVRIHFPELFVKIQDITSDVGWLVHELKIMLDQKTRSIEILERDLNRERNDYIKVVSKSLEMENELCNTKRLLQESLTKASDLENEIIQKANLICNLEIELQLQKEEQSNVEQSEVDSNVSKCLPKEGVHGLIGKYNSICSDDFFCSSDNTELVTQAHIDMKAEHYLYSDSKNSPKKVSLNSLDTFRSSISNDVKEDSGIDISSRSQRSTSINDGAIMDEMKEKWTQTFSLLENNNDTCKNATELEAYYKNLKQCSMQKDRSSDTEQSDPANDVKSVITALRKVADANMSELAVCKATLAFSELRMEELEKENEKLRKMVEVDSQKYKQRIKELSEELLIKEENETGNLKRLENCLEKCASLEDQLSVLHLVHKQMVRSFPKCIAEQVSQIEKLVMELSGKSLGEEIDDGTGEARGDLFKVQQLHEKVNELETVLEKCCEEKSNYRERLQKQLEVQSMLETKLKWLSTEIRSKDDEFNTLKTKVSGVVIAQSSNDEEIKNLGEKIFRSHQTVNVMKEKLAYFEEMRKCFEEMLTRDIQKSNSVEKEIKGEGEFSRLKIELIENKREMDSTHVRSRPTPPTVLKCAAAVVLALKMLEGKKECQAG
ncbi:kinesin-like protein KIF20A [Ceratina calcarata]|uniref:Kinesin-like protein KIF20A n=1 Tax=Ceratina calcarata TaxID=156304 RepID=A0AAJ7JAB9_9HYME|nr:kinesin-like protein KIF20A [Ceratina calcarata]